ncbi:MAG: hypothetical protein F4X65_00855 [Chloroflexi bacterium]|nr:hypothetical protein [Chloroflexota bacterium]
MKEGISVEKLIDSIERDQEEKVDYLVRASAINALVNDRGCPRLSLEGYGDFGITPHAHTQLAGYTKIPFNYLERMSGEAPELFADNLNYWLQRDKRSRMIRTIGDQVRAILSPRYRRLDNHNFARVVLPGLERLDARIASCGLSDSRVYIKAVLQGVKVEMDPVTFEPALIISNSEVGAGAVEVRMAIHTSPCSNMVVWARPALARFSSENRLQRRHLGPDRSLGPEENVRKLPSNGAQNPDEQLFWEMVQETVERGVDPDSFNEFVDSLREARNIGMSSKEEAERVVEGLRRRKSLAEDEVKGILKYLFEEGDLSKFGLSNAITRFSQDVENYDRASFFERVGGEIIAMPNSQWRSLN